MKPSRQRALIHHLPSCKVRRRSEDPCGTLMARHAALTKAMKALPGALPGAAPGHVEQAAAMLEKQVLQVEGLQAPRGETG